MSLYAELKAQKKTSADDDYFVYYTYRKLSTYFTWISIKIGFSANFVTFLSLIADIITIYFILMGNWALAGILVHLAPVLDCSDGEVARYYIKDFKKTGYKKHYGGYLDEVLGTIGFSLLIFFTGYFMNHMWTGLFASFGLLMIIITSLTAKTLFENKKEIARNFEQKLFGNLKGRIGFGFGIQRLIISIAVFFYSFYFLLFFAIIANLFWILKFWLYRKL